MWRLFQVLVIIFIGIPIVVVFVRWLVIDWFVVATERFEPDIVSGQWIVVCRFCHRYEPGDYLVHWDEVQGKYLVEQVIVPATEEVVEVTSRASLSQDVRLQNVYGRVVWR